MRVVAVDAPRLQCAFHDEVVTGPADVIHDFFAAAFLKRLSNPASEGWATGPSSQDQGAANYTGVPWLIRAEDGDHRAGPNSRRGGLAGGPGYPP